MVGIRGRATDTVNHGCLGPRDCTGAPRARGPRIGSAVRWCARTADWWRPTGRPRWIVAESKRLLDEKGPLSHGFYTSGQLFLEEYYELAVIGKGRPRHPHGDGNTRLCTATSAAACKESFGADGQRGLLHRHRAL